jgi:hypothetical protein
MQNQKSSAAMAAATTSRVNLSRDQSDLIARSRGESVLSRRVSLGYPSGARPERGPDAINWFANKHRRNEFGKFYPLHQISIARH